MSLIGMAVYDTAENQRTWMTRKTLESLFATVDFKKHRLIVVDNNSCEETKQLLEDYSDEYGFLVITKETNLGTAEAVNLAWKNRKQGEHCIKMDNDVVIHSAGWLDELEEVVRRDELIGQAALKRKDCWECPDHDNPFYRSELMMLPHVPGERWMIVEKVNHCIGTCVLHSSKLLDAVGFLKQPLQYGLDDTLMSLRSRIAGFKNVFLSHIEIDHIDTGGGLFKIEKDQFVKESWEEYRRLADGYVNGSVPVYYNPFQ